MVLEKRLIVRLNDYRDENVQSASQKHTECVESAALVVFPDHELLTKISNLNLERREQNKDVAFKAGRQKR